MDGRYEFIRNTQKFEETFEIFDPIGVEYFLEIANTHDWWYRYKGVNK